MAKTPRTPKRPSIIDIDPTLLSDAEKGALRAAALDRLAAERKSQAEDAYLEQVIEEERRKLLPEQEMKFITLDMAGHSDRIMLDGVVYFHGQTYEIPKCVYDTMKEVVSRGWDHEDEIGGANRDQYRRPRNTMLHPGMEGITTSRLLVGR